MPVTKLLSSEARNKASLAISSEVPIRPIGTAAARPALTCSTCSSVEPRPSRIGVSLTEALRPPCDWGAKHMKRIEETKARGEMDVIEAASRSNG